MIKAFAALAAFAALSLSCHATEEIKPLPDPQWKAASDAGRPCYVLDCKGDGSSPCVAIEKPLEPGAFYSLSWKLKGAGAGEDAPSKASLQIDVGAKALYKYQFGAQWTVCYAYFKSDDAKAAVLKIAVSDSSKGKAYLKDMELKKLSPKDFRANLLPDGNFELSKDVSSVWSSEAQQMPPGSAMKLLNSQDFLYGERTLSISSDGAPASVRSIQLPVVPGQKYELRFWAKASCKAGLNATLQAWSPFGHKGKHFHRGMKFSLGTEWREFSFKFEIPAKIEDYSDLRDGLMFIVLGLSKCDNPVSVMLDDISFRQEDP